MSKKDLASYFTMICIIVALLVLCAYGITMTARSVMGESDESFTSFVTNASNNTRIYTITRLHDQEKQNQINREHHEVNQTKQHKTINMHPTISEQKRMNAVTKYLNTNNRSHGIKNIAYDPAKDSINITFAHKPNKKQIQYAKQSVHSLDAKYK